MITVAMVIEYKTTFLYFDLQSVINVKLSETLPINKTIIVPDVIR